MLKLRITFRTVTHTLLFRLTAIQQNLSVTFTMTHKSQIDLETAPTVELISVNFQNPSLKSQNESKSGSTATVVILS